MTRLSPLVFLAALGCTTTATPPALESGADIHPERAQCTSTAIDAEGDLTETEYDACGRMLVQRELDDPSDLISTETYTYADDGRLLRIDLDAFKPRQTVYSYDDGDRLTSIEATLLTGEPVQLTEFTYPSDDAEHADGKNYSDDARQDWTWDADGNLVHIETSYGGVLISTSDLTYDASGNEVSWIEVLAATGAIYETTREWDGDLLMRMVHVSPDGEIYEELYAYDAEGREIELSYPNSAWGAVTLTSWSCP